MNEENENVNEGFLWTPPSHERQVVMELCMVPGSRWLTRVLITGLSNGQCSCCTLEGFLKKVPRRECLWL